MIHATHTQEVKILSKLLLISKQHFRNSWCILNKSKLFLELLCTQHTHRVNVSHHIEFIVLITVTKLEQYHCLVMFLGSSLYMLNHSLSIIWTGMCIIRLISFMTPNQFGYELCWWSDFLLMIPTLNYQLGHGPLFKAWIFWLLFSFSQSDSIISKVKQGQLCHSAPKVKGF